MDDGLIRLPEGLTDSEMWERVKTMWPKEPIEYQDPPIGVSSDVSDMMEKKLKRK